MDLGEGGKNTRRFGRLRIRCIGPGDSNTLNNRQRPPLSSLYSFATTNSSTSADFGSGAATVVVEPMMMKTPGGGTVTRFTPVQGMGTIPTRLQAISCMSDYSEKSFEELRYEYLQNKKSKASTSIGLKRHSESTRTDLSDASGHTKKMAHKPPNNGSYSILFGAPLTPHIVSFGGEQASAGSQNNVNVNGNSGPTMEISRATSTLGRLSGSSATSGSGFSGLQRGGFNTSNQPSTFGLGASVVGQTTSSGPASFTFGSPSARSGASGFNYGRIRPAMHQSGGNIQTQRPQSSPSPTPPLETPLVVTENQYLRQRVIELEQKLVVRDRTITTMLDFVMTMQCNSTHNNSQRKSEEDANEN